MTSATKGKKKSIKQRDARTFTVMELGALADAIQRYPVDSKEYQWACEHLAFASLYLANSRALNLMIWYQDGIQPETPPDALIPLLQQ